METYLIIIGIVVYLVIGRIIAEKRWDWDGYPLDSAIYGAEFEIGLTTILWPLYLFWMGIKLIVSIFIDIDI